jgi:hypothetical protein
MAKNNREIVLTDEVVKKIVQILSKAVNKNDLNVKERQHANHMIGTLQAKLEATPGNRIKFSEELVGKVLITLANVLTDTKVIKLLIDLFFGDKK